MLRILCLAVLASYFEFAESKGVGAARLLCYTQDVAAEGAEYCTHIVYAGKIRGEKLEAILKENRKKNEMAKIILRITENDKNLKPLLKSRAIQGLEVYDAHRTLNRTAVSTLIGDARIMLSSIGGGPLFVHLPPDPELLAKYYDLRSLMKMADFMVAGTDKLGVRKNAAYHPSRLSGLWDMMNTDSVVDLIVGLGIPTAKIIVTLPATAYKFSLANDTLSTPGSPTSDEYPLELNQEELCQELSGAGSKWMVEREQDLSAPYAFRNSTWLAFEDSSSVDVKGKYARVRGLAGLALVDVERDTETKCGPSLLASLNKVLNSQSRMPRGAVLRSLENEILAPGAAGLQFLEELQVSPYRITQVVDSDGVIHSLREDTRTEFTCSRQGYFVHPKSCGRFYRCVKFDQTSPDFTVFEFDCPEGLAFDSKWEVCVWPGSLSDASACPGSSEIAPVPRQRFQCPAQEGYYADPENCRWFFACLDHGDGSMTAYEFRCPFGLGFDPARLTCEWPWLVPNCGTLGRYTAEVIGNGKLTGAAGYIGQTPDAINIAAHNSLLSGAALGNLVGVQASTEEPEVTGSFIADDLREPQHIIFSQPAYTTFSTTGNGDSVLRTGYSSDPSQGITLLKSDLSSNGAYTNSDGASSYVTADLNQAISKDYTDNGAYVHDTSGDYHQPYKHIESATVPYHHESDDRAPYVNAAGNIDGYTNQKGLYNQQSNKNSYYANVQNNYNSAYQSGYVESSNLNSGAAHTLTAGAINVGLVGKTRLVDTGVEHPYNEDVDFVDQGNNNYQGIHSSGVLVQNSAGVHNNAFSTVTSTPIYSTNLTPVTPYPQTHVSEVFGYTQPGVSLVSHAQQQLVSQPEVEVTNFNTPTSDVKYETETQPSGGNQFIYSTTPQPAAQVEFAGYDYPKPKVAFEEIVQKKVAYTTQEPYQVYAKQSISTVHHGQVQEVSQPVQITPIPITVTQPEKVQFVNVEQSPAQVEYSTPRPVSIVQPQIYTQTTIQEPVHQIDYNQYEYKKPEIGLQETPQVLYSTPKPSTLDQEEFNPEVIAEAAYPKVENPIKQIEFSGYDYSQPDTNFNIPITQTTVTPVNYKKQDLRSQVYKQQIFPKVDQPIKEIPHSYPTGKTTIVNHPQQHSQQISLPVDLQENLSPDYFYQKPNVSFQENPFDQFVNQPIIQTSFNSNNREKTEQVYINQNQEPLSPFQSFDNFAEDPQVFYEPQKLRYQPPVISHEIKHQSYNSKTHYKHENRIYNQGFAPNRPDNNLFIKEEPKTSYQSEYDTEKPSFQNYEQNFVNVPEFGYKVAIPQPITPIQRVVFSNERPQQIVESIHFTNQNQPLQYSTPKPVAIVQNEYQENTNEYLPPVTKTPEYLPPIQTVTEKYIPPVQTVTEKYLPPVQTVTEQYLPPVQTVTEKYLPPTQVTTVYIPPSTTSRPTTRKIYIPPSTTVREYLPPVTSTEKPSTVYVPTTTFRAPDYLPPLESEEIDDSKYQNFGLRQNLKNINGYSTTSTTALPEEYRKVKTVVGGKENKNLLGFGTVGPDAGLVAPPAYPTEYYDDLSSPVTSSYVTKKIITTTYAPIKQEIVEVTSKRPLRKKQKIAVVTKINDFNPLLVRKLGAVCSCKSSPIVVLKGSRGNSKDYTDYDYENLLKIREELEVGKTVRISYDDNGYTKSLPSSTLNPIIVPDDSFYTDYNDDDDIRTTIVSSSVRPEVASTAESVVNINPRVNRVTQAPTARSYLYKESPAVSIKTSNHIDVSEGTSLDRSDGGPRRRGETLQASVDCKRAGLFRHPKHCNKFYACRWDQHKERFTLHVFNCPIQLSFDPNLGACNWPSQGPACEKDTLLPSAI